MWGVYSLKHDVNDLYDINLSPFFFTSNVKEKLLKKNYFTFGSLTKLRENNSSSISQPYENIDQSYILVADARIDNKKDLLKKLNKDFLNNQDSNEELIVAAYKKWGNKFPKYIVGDFSIALWDNIKQQLICVRDRLGLKTFYYHKDDKLFSFASDISPLLHLSNYQPKPNINSMKQFLKFPTELEYEHTMYAGINTLPPAHILIVKNGNISLQRYWFPERIKINNELSFESAKKTFYELFQNAVRVRLDPFSHTGVTLSGGLDSSSVVAMAKKNHDISPIISCSVRYGEYKCDESGFIQSMVKKSNLNSIYINGNNTDFESKYNLDFIYSLNPVWPNFVNSAVMIPLVERMHEKGIHVVLTGLGGDETSTGSSSIITDYLKTYQWRAIFSELMSCRFNLKIIKSHLLVPLLSKKQKILIKKFMYLLHLREKERVDKSTNLINVEDCASFEQAAHIQAITSKYFSFWSNALFVHVFKQYDIEYRHPFYDTQLIEFLLSLPPGFKYKNGTTKYLLRESMKELLSSDVYERRDKAEFSEVLYDQINAINLHDFWKDKYIVKLGIVSEKEVNKIVNQFNTLRSKNDYTVLTPLWRLINLEKWYRVNFVD